MMKSYKKIKKIPILKYNTSLIQSRNYAKKQPADVADKPASALYEYGPEGYLFPGKLREDWPLHHENDQAMLPDSFNGWKPYHLSKFWGFWVLVAGVTVYFCVESEKYKLEHAWDKDERPYITKKTNEFGDPLHLIDDEVRRALQPTGLYPYGSRSEIYQTELTEKRKRITKEKYQSATRLMEAQVNSEKITPDEIFSMYYEGRKNFN
eukprot:TRINITY_DN2354_c0_g1_i1.p1 TRINITY_DN2354_c0_g1~~TRINITY_DN2354_c0_g1_i1.p1  ORF type:complete len:208 (-),score=45.68 TRINITY_DN2354_c0_g1_i1:64-687(-)